METPGIDPRRWDAYWDTGEPYVLSNPRVEMRTPTSAQVAALGLRGHAVFGTSGSSGDPKWVALSQTALRTSARGVNAHLRVSATDRWLRALPAFHVGGFAVHVRHQLTGGELFWDDTKWNARPFAEHCQRAQITLTSLVPAQVFDLVSARIPAPACLRGIVVGGGHLSTPLWCQARDLGWPLLTSYGMTEASSQIATQSGDEPDPTVLTVLPHWDVRAESDDRLALSGPALFSAYLLWRDGKWMAQPPAEWFITGDRVALQGNRLRFLGRSGRQIKVLGEWVDLDELQRRLENLCATAGFFGGGRVDHRDDPRAGAEVTLCLSADIPEPTAAEIYREFNATLPGYSRARSWQRSPAFRRSALGKPLPEKR